MRRVHLRGHRNILKRVLVHAGASNPGLLMRHLIGVDTPRSLQGRAAAVLALGLAIYTWLSDHARALGGRPRRRPPITMRARCMKVLSSTYPWALVPRAAKGRALRLGPRLGRNCERRFTHVNRALTVLDFPARLRSLFPETEV